VDTYTISALAIGGFALVIGVSRLIFRAFHIAKYGPAEGHNGVSAGVGLTVQNPQRVTFRTEKRTPRQ
jgi:hypothetical protein